MPQARRIACGPVPSSLVAIVRARVRIRSKDTGGRTSRQTAGGAVAATLGTANVSNPIRRLDRSVQVPFLFRHAPGDGTACGSVCIRRGNGL